MSAYFITGAGTGIGKTFTTCALLESARAQGITAQGYKPVISGWDDSEATDTAQIIRVSGSTKTIEEISPWRFRAPLSPHRAAALENATIPFDRLVKWTQTQASATGLTLIETVGGVMVPFDNTYTTLDWMRAAQLPVVMVTGSYLGAISHTLTALAVLEQAGIHVAAVVVNESEGSSVDFAEAQAGLIPFLTNNPLRIFQPRVSCAAKAAEIAALVNHL